jgi:hypothetical protein
MSTREVFCVKPPLLVVAATKLYRDIIRPAGETYTLHFYGKQSISSLETFE